MKVSVITPTSSSLKIAKKSLKYTNLKISYLKKPEERFLKEADIVIVFGVDRDVLRASHYIREHQLMLGVNMVETPSFFTSTTSREFPRIINKLLTEDYQIEECIRLAIEIDEEIAPPALNEVAVFPTKSAVLMEYRLNLNGEVIWRDYSDGVIIATPTGSTAYALSVGGPVLMPHTKAFVIVPVNSLDLTHKPLVVPEDSIITLDEINSRYECEAIIDGVDRRKVEKFVKIFKGPTIKLIRFRSEHLISKKIEKRVKITEELLKMPPSAKLVLKVLENEGPLTQKTIIEKTLLPARTVRHALSILLSKGLIAKRPSLRDARQDLYYLIIKKK